MIKAETTTRSTARCPNVYQFSGDNARPGLRHEPAGRRTISCVCASLQRSTTRCEPARSSPVAGDGPTKGDRIAAAQAIPIKFLENILSELRNAGIVATQRGVEGGYWLARPADQITLAEVMRALEGPLANVRGHRPETLVYEGSAKALVELWIAVRASLRTVLETTTVADLANGELPGAGARADGRPRGLELALANCLAGVRRPAAQTAAAKLRVRCGRM